MAGEPEKWPVITTNQSVFAVLPSFSSSYIWLARNKEGTWTSF